MTAFKLIHRFSLPVYLYTCTAPRQVLTELRGPILVWGWPALI